MRCSFGGISHRISCASPSFGGMNQHSICRALAERTGAEWEAHHNKDNYSSCWMDKSLAPGDMQVCSQGQHRTHPISQGQHHRLAALVSSRQL